MKFIVQYNPFDHFIFRTPLFPFDYIQKKNDLQKNKAFSEALLVASPDLSEGIVKGEDRAQYSAHRYYQRSCTRSTPFGLFAGCSVGTIGKSTDILLVDQKEYKRITRLDMNYICALIQQIEKNKYIREQLCYYPNNSIYPVGSKLRFVEYYYYKTRRSHKISQIDCTDYIQKVLKMARTGALFSELIEVLIDDEVTNEDAAVFIHELIDIQLLMSELAPAVTNTKPLTSLIDKLKKISLVEKQLIDVLSTIETQLSTIDSQSIGNTIPIYQMIIKNIEKTKVDSEIKYLFQADMYKPVQRATVSKRLIQDVQQALVFLNKITPPSIGKSNLLKFKENFLKRYDDREMPLLFVLDNELGIGYADNISGDTSPLVDDLVAFRSNSSSIASRLPIQSVLMQKNQQFSRNIIELTDDDVKGVEAVWDDMPPTFSVLCQVLQDNEEGRSCFIQSVLSHSGANFLGRFCHLDKQILNHTLAITRKEAEMNPNVIFAEIVHLPESRIGNILLRPVLREYEIPYLAKSSVSDQFELRPEDLFVSIRNNHIQLFSKRLNKIIVPRMSTAHYYNGMNSMPVYQFMCDLQNQNGRTGLWLRWDDSTQQLDFLPRIIYKNCVLSRARWRGKGKDVKSLVDIKNNDELLQRVKEWKNERNIPDQFLLNDGDNELYVDTNSPLSIRAWLSIVKNRLTFELEEFLFNPATAVVHNSEGSFTNEFIFSFYREILVKK